MKRVIRLSKRSRTLPVEPWRCLATISSARPWIRSISSRHSLYLASVAASADPATPFPDPGGRFDAFYRSTDVPVLALSGDHDIIFPVENWYALNDIWPTLFVVTFPESGHGPQHQYPVIAADMIASFVQNS